MATDENNILSNLDEKVSASDVADLKLQLNASQQIIASLELKVRQKEEVILKTQADSARQAEIHRQELIKVKEELKETSKIIENSSTSELQQSLQQALDREKKLTNDLYEKCQKEQKMSQMLTEYDRIIAEKAAEYKKLSELHEQVTGSLATLEMAFHDVIQKYERSKIVIEGFKANESVFNESVEMLDKNLKVEMERYDSLKAHAITQIDKANKENCLLKQQLEHRELKQNAIIKRLEIKAASLENSLEQKIKECADLAALCDEVTGKRV